MPVAKSALNVAWRNFLLTLPLNGKFHFQNTERVLTLNCIEIGSKMFGSIPTISQVPAPSPFTVPSLAPVTPSMVSSNTPGFIPSTRLFTSPSYTLPTHSTTIRTPYSATVAQPQIGHAGQESHVGHDGGDHGGGGGVLFSHPLNVIVQQGSDGEKRQQLKV